MPHIVLLGTLDTTFSEILYLRQQLQQFANFARDELKCTPIDCGRRPITHEAITISQS